MSKEFIIIVPNYWGRGKTIDEAKKQLKKAGGRLTMRPRGTFMLPEGAKDAFVDDMCYVQWTWEEDAPNKNAVMEEIEFLKGSQS